MVGPRTNRPEPSRPALLVMVIGVVLVLVGVTASALVAVTSYHFRSVTLNSVVSRDAALVSLFVNSNLVGGDLADAGPGSARINELTRQLASLRDSDSIVRIEIRDLDGRVIVSDLPASQGLVAVDSAAMREARAGSPGAVLLEAGTLTEAAGRLDNRDGVVQEYFPILDESGAPVAVVGLWRDAGNLVSALDASSRDVLLVTLVAGALLAAMLFLLFRASQARLSRQHRQLLDATQQDALTGLLNHGAVVARLAEELEAARGTNSQIGVALVDVDNFRLFNATHGHEAGDQVLLAVAQVVAATEGAVARYGPDEFLIVRPGSGAAEMEVLAAQVRRDLEQVSLRFDGSEELPVTVSVGICAYPEHADAATELLSAATVALSEAKASGGDAVRAAAIGEEKRVVAGSFDVLQGLVIAVDTKDRYTKRHSEDVARYAVFLARRIGLDDEMLRTIQLAGLLHDIGKIGIPDVVLRKPSRLTDDEYRMFQQHVALGDAIVRDVPNVELVRAGIRHHHERWDGDGYLEGLAGDEIPVIGRILAVADAFSAMTTPGRTGRRSR